MIATEVSTQERALTDEEFEALTVQFLTEVRANMNRTGACGTYERLLQEAVGHKRLGRISAEPDGYRYSVWLEQVVTPERYQKIRKHPGLTASYEAEGAIRIKRNHTITAEGPVTLRRDALRLVKEQHGLKGEGGWSVVQISAESYRREYEPDPQKWHTITVNDVRTGRFEAMRGEELLKGYVILAHENSSRSGYRSPVLGAMRSLGIDITKYVPEPPITLDFYLAGKALSIDEKWAGVEVDVGRVMGVLTIPTSVVQAHPGVRTRDCGCHILTLGEVATLAQDILGGSAINPESVVVSRGLKTCIHHDRRLPL